MALILRVLCLLEDVVESLHDGLLMVILIWISMVTTSGNFSLVISQGRGYPLTDLVGCLMDLKGSEKDKCDYVG